jgi:S-adenosylmethionine:tRNA ribosyltransferase-isomerase
MTNYSLADFQYELPEELIAQEPLPVRHESRLMYVNRAAQSIEHHSFSGIVELLSAGDLVVVNDTRVIPARLFARRHTGGAVEILLLKPLATQPGQWEAMATPLRKLKEGEQLTVEAGGKNFVVIIESIITAADGQKRVVVNLGKGEGVYALLSEIGYAPLPPYIKRNADEQIRGKDLERYQTIFAQSPGAVAAPTAGLHFSPELLERLKARDIGVATLTLHVGPGTFKPITTDLDEHHIEAERFSISKETADLANAALAESRRIIAVGTTSCRALESAFSNGRIQETEEGQATLFIKPGYKFNVVRGLITNFHLSKSSLLVLVSSFAGHDLIMRAYKEAVRERYRFFSYGDAMLIL